MQGSGTARKRLGVLVLVTVVMLALASQRPVSEGPHDEAASPPPPTTTSIPPSSSSTAADPTTTTASTVGVTTTAPGPPPTTRSGPPTVPRRPAAAPPSTTTGHPPTAASRPAPVPPPAPNSANQNVFWYECDSLMELTDAELDAWKARGVGGWNCSTRQLKDMGGTQDYTGDRTVDLAGEHYERQRKIRSSRIVERVHARGMKIYLGFWVANYHVPVTPFGDWFDDGAWETTVLPKIRDAAAMARAEGFDGLTIDEEDYPGDDGRRHSWQWNYPGNTRSESDVRAKVTQRGRQVMETIAAAFPDATINVYHWNFPGSWQELVQHKVNDAPADNAAASVYLEFWSGVTSVPGYGRISFLDATFYKSTHLGASWDTALQYNANRLFATFSRSFGNWTYAASRVQVLPFSWIDDNPSEWPYRRQTAEEVDAQLAAFRKWGMGGEFFNFVYNRPISSYDYGPYLPAMRAAATAGSVDAQPPVLTVGASPAAAVGSTISLTGSAADDLAVRSVRWETAGGRSGQARMTWNGSGDSRGGYRWQMDWQADGIPISSGRSTITITAEDIKGLTTARTLTIDL
jgi:hypothetical protein